MRPREVGLSLTPSGIGHAIRTNDAGVKSTRWRVAVHATTQLPLYPLPLRPCHYDCHLLCSKMAWNLLVFLDCAKRGVMFNAARSHRLGIMLRV